MKLDVIQWSHLRPRTCEHSQRQQLVFLSTVCTSTLIPFSVRTCVSLAQLQRADVDAAIAALPPTCDRRLIDAKNATLFRVQEACLGEYQNICG